MTVDEAIKALQEHARAGRGGQQFLGLARDADALEVSGYDGEVRVCGDTLLVDLWYPRNSGVWHVEIDLVDVRAADGLRVSYDFDRDGFVVEQPVWAPSEPDHDLQDVINVSGWREVAFCPAWRHRGVAP